jgi:ABC-2 type transport system ATP-binding protein
MLIIDKGKKVAEGSVAELFDDSNILVQVELVDAADITPKLIQTQWHSKLMEVRGNKLVFQMDKQFIPLLAQDLTGLGARIISLQPRHSLEDYFLSLTTANQHVDSFTD